MVGEKFDFGFVYLFGFFVLPPLFLLRKGWGFFQFLLVFFWNITGLAEEKICHFCKNIPLMEV